MLAPKTAQLAELFDLVVPPIVILSHYDADRERTVTQGDSMSLYAVRADMADHSASSFCRQSRGSYLGVEERNDETIGMAWLPS
jgi:hypothetical protein